MRTQMVSGRSNNHTHTHTSWCPSLKSLYQRQVMRTRRSLSSGSEASGSKSVHGFRMVSLFLSRSQFGRARLTLFFFTTTTFTELPLGDHEGWNKWKWLVTTNLCSPVNKFVVSSFFFLVVLQTSSWFIAWSKLPRFDQLTCWSAGGLNLSHSRLKSQRFDRAKIIKCTTLELPKVGNAFCG